MRRDFRKKFSFPHVLDFQPCAIVEEWNARYGSPLLESNPPHFCPQRFSNPGSGRVKGIGAVQAGKLVNKFG
jgi:hypothetical protein